MDKEGKGMQAEVLLGKILPNGSAQALLTGSGLVQKVERLGTGFKPTRCFLARPTGTKNGYNTSPTSRLTPPETPSEPRSRRIIVGLERALSSYQQEHRNKISISKDRHNRNRL
mgnify:CR=1 FL=1